MNWTGTGCRRHVWPPVPPRATATAAAESSRRSVGHSRGAAHRVIYSTHWFSLLSSRRNENRFRLAENVPNISAPGRSGLTRLRLQRQPDPRRLCSQARSRRSGTGRPARPGRSCGPDVALQRAGQLDARCTRRATGSEVEVAAHLPHELHARPGAGRRRSRPAARCRQSR